MSKSGLRIVASVVGLIVFAITPALAADAAAGHAVYDKKCKTCHAANGEGNAGLAKAMGVTIPPLGSADVQKMSDADLKKVVTSGKGKMKPVTGLSDADVDNVIAFVRTLKK